MLTVSSVVIVFMKCKLSKCLTDMIFVVVIFMVSTQLNLPKWPLAVNGQIKTLLIRLNVILTQIRGHLL